jgi:hypothetical protein
MIIVSAEFWTANVTSLVHESVHSSSSTFLGAHMTRETHERYLRGMPHNDGTALEAGVVERASSTSLSRA